MTASPPPVEPIQSLTRGLAVIRAFDAEHASMTLADVARRTALPRATVRRVLATLVAEDYAASEDGRFRLRPRILELGFSYLSALGLPAVAQPHLEALSRRVQESTSLAVLDGRDIVYVARVATRRIMSVQITVGTRFPAYATSMGRVLLAGLPADDLTDYLAEADISPRTPGAIGDAETLRQTLDTVRSRGWAMVDQELERGLRSVAAPVLDDAGATVAAVNVSTTVADDRTLPDDILPDLLDCTRAIAADLPMTADHSPSPTGI